MTTENGRSPNREEVLRWIEDAGIVPVVRAPSPELAVRAADALLAGGVSVFEITLTVPGAVGVIQTLAERFHGKAIVGAGTVLNPEDASACIAAGAQFIVSPGFNAPTVDIARAFDLAVMPGALTPTEVMAAMAAGADMVKIFPCSAMGGAKYLKALRGPFPNTKFMPTGGVSAATAAEYIAAGASALGLGSELVDIAGLKAGNDGLLTEKARELVAIVRAARASGS
jgi:2-dehydro-3-deoxyphosphogluconate aldolase/(4S)-4-hydroxy-2-oxoglutarate aldolase